MKNIILILFSSLVIYACGPKSYLNDDQLLEHTDAVVAADIEHHVAVLANDSMKGRLPGTPEYDIAMNYVAKQFKALGVKPLGDKEGSYFQQLILRNSIIDASRSYMLLNSKDTLLAGEDYFFLPNNNHDKKDFAGEMLLAGYGIAAPDFDHNDYDGLDATGKIVIVFAGAPESFPSSERAHYSNMETKFSAAADRGAIGVIFTTPPSGRGNFKGSYDRVAATGVTGVVLPSGEVVGRRTVIRNLSFGAYIDFPLLEKLTGMVADSVWSKYERGALVQPAMTATLSGTVVSTMKDIPSANVVGVLEGSELKDEYIVHSAHLDHVGIGTPVNGDSIYNGAHDNASGTSALIEIARLYSTLKTTPKRSVIFVAVTAEEMGLLGSEYFAKNPPVAKEKIIANINTDMPTLIAPLLSVEPLGAQHSSIMKQVQHAADLLQLEVQEDHMPEEVRFVRSDQYNFIAVGIPALHIKYGLKTADSSTGLKEKIEDYTKNVYHKPSDELNDLFDFEAGRTYVKLQFMISYLLNIADDRPVWNEGDFFGKEK